MAIYTSGVLGRPSGKLGPIVIYMLNGRSVARTIGKPGKISDKQRANHQAMSVTMEYLKEMVESINHGFGIQAKGTIKNAFNLATSYNKKQALQGEYPNLSVNYSKVVLSQGPVIAPQATTMVKVENGVEVTWNPYHDKFSKKDDVVMIMLYKDSEINNGAINRFYAAQRSDGKCFIPCQRVELDEPLEGYMFFKSNDGKKVSDSVYLGNLNGVRTTKAQKEEQLKYEKVKKRFAIVDVQYNEYMNYKSEVKVNKKAYYSTMAEHEVLQKQLAEFERLGNIRSDE